MKRLKIAALIAGEPRFTEDFDVFLQRTSSYEIDWFFMLWSKSGLSNSYFKSSLVPEYWNDVSYDAAYSKLLQNLPSQHNIAKLEILNQDNFKLDRTIKNKPPETNAENCWLMFQGLKEVEKLIPVDASYDLVVRTRPDLMIQSPIDLHEINQILEESPNSLIMPQNFWFGYGPVANDVFAIAKPEVMKIYCDVISSIPKFQETGVRFHPETMLATHLQQHNINVIRHNFEIELRYVNAKKEHIHGPRIPSFGRWE